MKTSDRPDKRPYSVLNIDSPDKFTGKAYERGRQQRIPYVGIVDGAGREILVGSFGELVTGQKQVDVSAAFQYFVDPDRVTETNTGTGATSIDNSRLKLTANGGVGTCEVKSRAPITYRPGLNSFAEFTAAFDPYRSGTTQECGTFDVGGNGYSLSINSEDKLVVNHYRSGTLISSVAQGSVPGEGFAFDQLDGTGLSGFTANPQHMNLFRIIYGYLGIAPAVLEIYGGTMLGWIPFHIVETINTTNRLIIEDPHLPITFKVTSDGTNNVAMLSGSWLGGSIGTLRSHSENSQFSADVSKTALTGTVTLLSIRVKSTFKTKTNKIPVDLHEISAGITSNKPNIVHLILNGTLTGGSFSDVDTNSCVEFDTTGTVSGGRKLRSWGVEQDGTLNSNFEEGEVRIVADDILSVVLITAGTNVDVNAGLHWDELR